MGPGVATTEDEPGQILGQALPVLAFLTFIFFPSGFAVLSGIGPTGERSVAVSFCIPLVFLLGGGSCFRPVDAWPL